MFTVSLEFDAILTPDREEYIIFRARMEAGGLPGDALCERKPNALKRGAGVRADSNQPKLFRRCFDSQLTGELSINSTREGVCRSPGIDFHQPGLHRRAQISNEGQVRTTTTGPDGAYRFTLLQPGGYKVRFSANGFKTSEVSSITLNVTRTPQLDRTLVVGAQSEQVTVEATTETLQTQSSTLGTTVDSKCSGRTAPQQS